jgi:hypothetical protein|tara:strand:+ start:12913 stop:13284 length:372 start_codon:yes stop_codon:yes gene_type:complete
MASTNLKNCKGMYDLEQREKRQFADYLQYKQKKVPVESTLPGLGLNVGNMIPGYYFNVLSNNTCEIESDLYGIGSSNLVNPKKQLNPSLNTLNETTIMKKPELLMPEPFVVERYQRPGGPFCQ